MNSCLATKDRWFLYVLWPLRVWVGRDQATIESIMAFSGDHRNDVIPESFRNGTKSYLTDRAQNKYYFYPS